MGEPRISELVSIPEVQRLLDAHYRVLGIPTALLDPAGELLAAAGWQDLCVRFLHSTAAGLAACDRARAAVTREAARGGPFEYRCEHGPRGLGVPVPLAALPLLQADQVCHLLDFYQGLVGLIAKLGGSNLELHQRAEDRGRAEEEARASELRFREVLENVHLAAVILDLDARVTFCNPHLARLLGWEREEIVGRNWFETFLPPEVRGRVHEAYRGAIGSADFPLHYENEIVTRSGERRFIAWNNTVLRDADGSVLGATAIGEDITERRNADEALREGKRRLNRAQELAHVGNWELDLGTGAVWASQEAFRIYGIERNTPDLPLPQVQGQVHPDDRPRMDAALARLLRDGTTYDEEFRIRRAGDGEERVIHSLADLLRDEEGKPLRVLGVLQDVTERRRGEEERQRLEAQVLQAQKLESLGLLAGGIAHDFNNLLAAILGNADLAQLKLPPDSPALDNLREVEKASLRAAELCRQMLAYSGRGRFLVEPVDLSEVVREMTGLLEVSISKKVALVRRLAPDLPAVEADATQVRQVVLNLLTNAAEAIGEECGTITLTTGLHDCGRAYLAGGHLGGGLPPGRYVLVEVSDTGCGMDDETRARLFDPFFTTKFTGRGLGLAAVLGIVRGHRGTIRIESAPGRGSTFQVLLPAGGGDSAASFTDGTGAGGWRGSGTVLLVDDEPTVREVGAQMLEHLGFGVRTAADGQEALAAVAESPGLACVVLDLTMPRLGGEETLRELRRRGVRTPVVLASGYSEHEVSRRLADSGVAAFIQKPYRASDLAAVLRKAVGSNHGDTAA